MAKKNRKIASRGYRAFRVCNVIIMILLMVVILVPILSVVVNSFVSAAEIARRGVFILVAGGDRHRQLSVPVGVPAETSCAPTATRCSARSSARRCP